jgi:CheY-like chemotaxis protein
MSLHFEFDEAGVPAAPPDALPCPETLLREMGDRLTLILAAAERGATDDGPATWREDAARIERQARALAATVARLHAAAAGGAAPPPAAHPRPPAVPVHAQVLRGTDAAGADRPLVLVIDDQARMCDLLAQTFADRCDVAVAGTLADALVLADELLPDLVVAESSLPDAGPDELLAALRARPAHGATPVVLLTLGADVVERTRLLKLGADDLLGKPFAPADARRRIGALLAQRPRPARPPDVPFGRTWGEQRLRAALDDALRTAARHAHAASLVIARVLPPSGPAWLPGGDGGRATAASPPWRRAWTPSAARATSPPGSRDASSWSWPCGRPAPRPPARRPRSPPPPATARPGPDPRRRPRSS